MKFIESKYRSDRFSVCAVNNNPAYYFFIPIVSCLWSRNIGYKPLIYIVDRESKWLNSHRFIIDLANNFGADIGIINPDKLCRYRGNKIYPSMLAQISRFSAINFPCIKNDDYYITSDIDMLPFDKQTFYKNNMNYPVNLWFSNAYKHKRYNMCYIGAKSKIWQKIMKINEKDVIYSNLKKLLSHLPRRADKNYQWNFDELLFYKLIKKWPGYPKRCEMMHWPVRRNPGFKRHNAGVPLELPIGRLDRSNWNYKAGKMGVIDAHCKRPSHGGIVWNELNSLFKDYMDENDLDIINNYRDKFLNLGVV